MSRRRGGASIAGSPVLIGALTTLVVIVAVFLSYNANSGLPFVPTYDVTIELPDAANLVEGNEVRLGGFRIGAVDTITPVRRSDGTAFVRIKLKLQKNVEKLPRDTTVLVRSRSALGLKYVEITPGKQPKDQGFPPGSTIPIAQAKPEPVEFDDVINTFDRKTRVGQQNSIRGIGDALTGRGIDINETISVLPELLTNLNLVARNLNDPATQFDRLFPALERVARISATVADTQADLFDNLDTTFTSLASVAVPFIQETISKGPAALDAGIRGFPEQRKLLENTTAFASDLAPGAHALPDVMPDLADALEAGIPALKRTPELNRRVEALFRTLEDFSTDPLVKFGIERLNDTVATLNPTLAFFTPTQTTCNYVTLFFRNIASLLSEGDKNGTWQRFIIITTPQGPNSESGPSSGPANGPTIDNFLHANNYPNTAGEGQERECEAGNETFFQGKQSIGNIPGNQGTKTFATGTDKAGSGF